MSDGRAALERLIRIAQADTGQSRKVANFLLAWWNAAECGGFDMTDVWGVDTAIAVDMLRVFALRMPAISRRAGLRQAVRGDRASLAPRPVGPQGALLAPARRGHPSLTPVRATAGSGAGRKPPSTAPHTRSRAVEMEARSRSRCGSPLPSPHGEPPRSGVNPKTETES